jgi:uncharacterized protein (DUF1501 family)
MSTPSSRQLGCRSLQQSLGHGRRDFLRAGVLGAGAAWGLSLPDVLKANAAAGKKSDTSVIILWMRGGPSHIDMWDMKPEAPAEYRGEFEPIATKVPGINICEHLPLTAACMDKWSIIRSMNFRKEDGEASHSTGDQICFTGYPSGKSPDMNVHPSVGSIVKKQLQHHDPKLPAYVMVPKMPPGADSAYLGPAYRPFETQADPADTSNKFVVPNLAAPDGVSVSRVADRRSMLSNLDKMRRDIDESGMMNAMDAYSSQAWNMVTSPAVRKAFDFDSETAETRARYGSFERYQSYRTIAGGDAPNWGQRILLARRLVEAGVRIVTVDCRWWDTHEDNFWTLKNIFLPRWDLAYSALINDLHDRGLLEKTMVVAWGEMGRMPKINTRGAPAITGGRDHWPNAMSVAVAGGGMKGGRTIGSTTARAEVPKDNPKITQDMLATIYRHLGVDPTVSYTDHLGRPHPVLPAGKPIDELF